ncbi:serine/threonine protein kinase [Shewanella sp. GutCb]|uniref:serine/threonine-protein kinase n=1 Tax=Shewanella sp. GutCb TaxID=2058315 RepID=UPI000C7D954E|nr:serine/threonine-protein kinase [Shewanella sp. GutCb]PKG73050.1 serine/threonine protein kinase [Shewanella sp. GutCb]
MPNLYLHYCHLVELSEKDKNEYIDSLKHDEHTYLALKKMMFDVKIDITQIFNDSIKLAGEHITGNICYGDKISKYKVTALLGKGGMGSVYLGKRQDGEYTQDVAIKIVPLVLMNNKSEQVFNYEAQTLASLSHTNIVSVLDAGRDDRGFGYVVMQYIKGETLSKYIEKNQLSERILLNVFIQIVNGITHAHANQILHRDIKPENILVDESGHVHIIDFGISTFITPTSNHDKMHINALSMAYASPEQRSGKRMTIRSDIYSLGRVLATLIDDKPILQAIVNKATKSSESERYQTTTELNNDINNYLTNKPTTVLTSQWRSASLWFKRNFIVFFITVSIMLISIFSAVKYYESYVFAQQQAILANSNLKLAEQMLKQVDVKVVTEVERQRALVNSAGNIDMDLLPLTQAVRFTLAIANAYKAIGDYNKCQEYVSTLFKLTSNNKKYTVENIISRKIQIELDVLNNNKDDMQNQLIKLNADLALLKNKTDNRLFNLLDWEVGTTTISNVELKSLFNTLTPSLVPLNTSQDILLKHIKLVSLSSVSMDEQLVGVETLLGEIESNISDVSSKRWVSLLHDWYLMSNVQGRQSSSNISERLIDNAQLLQSLLDSSHPSVYVLAILAKQASVINGFLLPDSIADIYNNIDPGNLPPSYQTNYYIIELTESIKQNAFIESYEIMKKVYTQLPYYGENALNYYLQFTVFANKFGRQDLYIDHLQTLINHYNKKKNLGHAAYFTYAYCSNSTKISSQTVKQNTLRVKACDESMAFYKKYQGEKSNFYILSLISKLRHVTQSKNISEINTLLKNVLSVKDNITYPKTEQIYYASLAKAYFELSHFNKAKKTIDMLRSLSENDFEALLLNVELMSLTGEINSVNLSEELFVNIDCNTVTDVQISEIQGYIRGSKVKPFNLCSDNIKWKDIVKDDKLNTAIYSSVDHFLISL